jgi:NAD(P)-dependent dehydrogenase (short-subunit alcohol dehydrogenase family)
LAGRTVLITGASQGLGRAIALACALEGADLLLVARRAGPLEEARAEAESLGARAIAVTADVGDPADAERVAATALDAFDRVDVLVNNASELGPTPMPYLIDTDPDALRRVLEVNLLGPFLLTRALLGPMLAAGSGPASWRTRACGSTRWTRATWRRRCTRRLSPTTTRRSWRVPRIGRRCSSTWPLRSPRA